MFTEGGDIINSRDPFFATKGQQFLQCSKRKSNAWKF